MTNKENQVEDKEECLKIIEEQIKESDKKYEQLKEDVKGLRDLSLKSGVDSKNE